MILIYQINAQLFRTVRYLTVHKKNLTNAFQLGLRK